MLYYGWFSRIYPFQTGGSGRLKDLAIGAAREAGKLMLEWRSKFPPGPAKMDYKGAKDVVT